MSNTLAVVQSIFYGSGVLSILKLSCIQSGMYFFLGHTVMDLKICFLRFSCIGPEDLLIPKSNCIGTGDSLIPKSSCVGYGDLLIPRT